MNMIRTMTLVGLIAVTAGHPAAAERFDLLTGVDARYWPAVGRTIPPWPGPGYDGVFNDGDRLAGTADVGPIINFQGGGTPLFQPNAFGSLSMTFKRCSVPLGFGQLPYMSIDFFGGPLLDLDGDLNNGMRSLIPVTGQSAVAIPDTASGFDLSVDVNAGTVTLGGFDATSTSEGSPGISWTAAISVNLIAGTELDGSQSGPINPQVDTRVGTLTSFTGTSGTLTGVYRIENLGYELWQDTLLSNSATAHVLGTFQFLGTFRGWLIERNPLSESFPNLTGEGLGSTLWPMIDTTGVGQVYTTANGLAGGSATIADGITWYDFGELQGDLYTVAGNGGTALTDFGGDLGAYLSTVVAPLVTAQARRFVYLEATGVGLNNSSDPIYGDTIGYDVILIAESVPTVDGDFDQDGDVDLADFARLQECFTGPGPALLGPGCGQFDFTFDDDVDLDDYVEFAARLIGP